MEPPAVSSPWIFQHPLFPKSIIAFHIVFSVLLGIRRWIKFRYLSSGNLSWVQEINRRCWEEAPIFATPKALHLLERLHVGNHTHRHPSFWPQPSCFSLPYSQSANYSPLSGPLDHRYPPSLSVFLLLLPYSASLVSVLHLFNHFLAGLLSSLSLFLP